MAGVTTTPTLATVNPRSRPRRGAAAPVLLATALGALLLLLALTLMYGAVNLSPGEAWSGLTSESNAFARNVVW